MEHLRRDAQEEVTGDELALAETFQEAVQAVRVAVTATGAQHCQVELQPISSPGANRLALPVVRPRGWFATIVCTSDRGCTAAQVHELLRIANQLSVWCTERSFPADTRENPTLTPRQLEIAQLAARGHTNGDIAEMLAISINTVKVRLKQVFERLHVANRTELANVLPRIRRRA